MPSGWMPDARHDLRMRPAFESQQQDRHQRHRTEQRHRLHLTFHHHRRPLHGSHA